VALPAPVACAEALGARVPLPPVLSVAPAVARAVTDAEGLTEGEGEVEAVLLL
jgi:hypothetical protein